MRSGVSLNALTTGARNTAAGAEAANDVKDGDENTAVGFQALEGVVSGSTNTAFGFRALGTVAAGASGNIAVGTSAGDSLTLADSDNICIGNAGVAGNDDEIRIGTSGTHTDTFHVGNQWVKQGASTDLGDTAPTLTTAQLQSFLLRGTPTMPRAWTLPTAAQMIGTDLGSPQLDDSFEFCIVNETDAAIITVIIPVDVTAFGDMVVGIAGATPPVSGRFRIRLTDITPASEAYEIYR